MGTTCCQNNQKQNFPLSELIQLEDFITECQPKEQGMTEVDEKLDYEKKWKCMTLRAKKKAIEAIGKGSR